MEGDTVGLIDEIRKLTSRSRAQREEQRAEEMEQERARLKWLKEIQIPKLARKYYRDICGQIKEAATTGEDGLDYTIDHYGKPSRLTEETYPAFRAVRKKLIKDGFDVSDIEKSADKVHDTHGGTAATDHLISCTILVSW